jgi:hypothetical protein
MRRFVRPVLRLAALLAASALLAGAPAPRAHAAEGGNADTDIDDDEGVDVPDDKVQDPDEIAPPDAKPRAHDEIPFPDAQPRAHDEIQPPDIKIPQ